MLRLSEDDVMNKDVLCHHAGYLVGKTVKINKHMKQLQIVKVLGCAETLGAETKNMNRDLF